MPRSMARALALCNAALLEHAAGVAQAPRAATSASHRQLGFRLNPPPCRAKPVHDSIRLWLPSERKCDELRKFWHTSDPEPTDDADARLVPCPPPLRASC